MTRIRLSTLAASLLAALLQTGCAESPQDAPSAAAAAASVETYATTRQVMLGLTIPASDYLFQLDSNRPTDDAGWERVEAMALMLAESGQLLTTGTRDLQQPEWRTFAQGMIDAARGVATAARTRDVDAVLDAGNVLYESCDNCHAKYLPARVAEEAAGKAPPAGQ